MSEEDQERIFSKEISLEELEEYSNSEDVWIRHSVAMKNKLSSELFEKLSRDDSPLVRKRIAWNRRTPREILERLANDPCPDVSESAKERLEL